MNSLNEIKKELKNSKIYVGAEFEFITDKITLDFSCSCYDCISGMRNRIQLLHPPFDCFTVSSRCKDNRIKESIGTDTTWYFKNDASLNRNGIELTSPPMLLEQFLEICPKVFDWIESIGHTDISCGFHVHMSITDSKGKKLRDISNINALKTALLVNEDLIYKRFRYRKNNQFCYSVLVADGLMFGLLNPSIKLNSKIDVYGMKYHYCGTNLENIQSGHVEFRYIGGKNYHKKFEAVQEIIFSYVDAFLAGLNMKYKYSQYKETYQKLQKELKCCLVSSHRRTVINNLNERCENIKDGNPFISDLIISRVKNQLFKELKNELVIPNDIDIKKTKKKWSYRSSGDRSIENKLEEYMSIQLINDHVKNKIGLAVRRKLKNIDEIEVCNQLGI